MRISRNTRNLSSPERTLALSVFGTSLPSWKRIFISDGLGLGDAPWTDNPMDLFYIMAVGPECYPDCTSRKKYKGFGRTDSIFIHEMVHVWQYNLGVFVKLDAIAARIWEKVSEDDAYEYTIGKPWNSYNVEEQASIVERWYDGGMKSTDDEFHYVEKVVRGGGGINAFLNLEQLKKLK